MRTGQHQQLGECGLGICLCLSVSLSLSQEIKFCHVPVAHTYNPSYLGGKDQEEQGLKPAQAKS
jgi:hypothetical protein